MAKRPAQLSSWRHPLVVWWRWCLAWCLALVLSTLSGWAVADGPVRTGTTSLNQPSLADPPAPAEPEAAQHQPPGDAPNLPEGLRVPAPPEDFNTYDGGWIQFAYHPSVRERVQPLIAQADEARAELTARLGQSVLHKVRVHVARTPGEMADLAPENAPFPKYASGVAYSQAGLILLTINPLHPNSRHSLPEIFKHELAHVAMHDAVKGRPVPRWFNEGFAVFASGESSFPRLQTLWQATLADELISLHDLEKSFPSDDVIASVAYAESADVVRFLVRQQERHRFSGLVERLRKGQGFDLALQNSYGIDLATLEYEWREDVAKRYTFWPVFFSGSVVWGGALTLFVWGWRRKRRRNKKTLERWAREEAVEDARRRQQREVEEPPRVHIVLARSSQQPSVPQLRPSNPDVEVPKVEHDGQWHTLH